MESTHRVIIISLCIVIVTAAGCGYRLAGLGSSLPEHLQSIAVPIFLNKTYEYGLENIVTQEMVNALNRRAGISTVKKVGDADAVLEGVITEYRYVPTLNSQRKVTQYYIHIVASVKLMDLVNDEVYWEDKNFRFSEIYKVAGGLSSIQSNRQKAWQNAAEDFSERIASVLLEGF